MAFVIFATTLFMRSVDLVIPQIAQDLNVSTTTAAMLSTGFTLPYALVQPVLGALADMFSKTRLIALCMLMVGVATLACGLATNFETLMILRVVAGATAGGVFPIALAVAGDRVLVQQRAGCDRAAVVCRDERQPAWGVGSRCDRRRFWMARRLLFHWHNRSCRARGCRSRVSEHGREAWPLRSHDFNSELPRMAKYCFGAVFVEAVFLFGVFTYGIASHRRRGTRFGRRRGDRRIWHRRRHLHFHGRLAAGEYR